MPNRIMEMPQAGLIGALSVGVYISRICFRRPNPPPSGIHGKDTALQISLLPNLREYIFLGLAVGHILLTAKYPPNPSPLWPYPENLNAKYFTCSLYIKIWLCMIYAAGALRIIAFK